MVQFSVNSVKVPAMSSSRTVGVGQDPLNKETVQERDDLSVGQCVGGQGEDQVIVWIHDSAAGYLLGRLNH